MTDPKPTSTTPKNRRGRLVKRALTSPRRQVRLQAQEGTGSPDGYSAASCVPVLAGGGASHAAIAAAIAS